MPLSKIPPRYWHVLLGLVAVLLLLLIWGYSRRETLISRGALATTSENIPLPMREMRAAWVATVNRIDWPTGPGASVETQKKEAVAILDKLVELNMNAVIFQVRPQGDALYQSDLEPWSSYLTGEQGQPPEPFYDPLAFWIEQAHRRGLQLHAWFNPFRASIPSHQGPISDQSIIKTNPELVVKLGDKGYWWMDPSLEESRKHTLKVVIDVVSRYDIDGVHLDDYFYPYPAYNDQQDFPDDTSYSVYQQQGGKMSLGDWRRDSVNQLIKELSARIKAEKGHVEFGISPFGIWRPGYPTGVAGLDQYDVLYADARLWLQEGWVDYFMPQLYWPIDAKNQSFRDLLVWWQEQNIKKRHLWPGLSLSVGKGDATSTATEIVNQINLTRELSPAGNPGACLFSMKGLMNAESIVALSLKEGPWSSPALIPTTPWLDQIPPEPPRVDLIRKGWTTKLARFQPENRDSFQFLVNEKRDGKWQSPRIVPGVYRSYPVKRGVEAIAVRTVDRLRNVSQPMIVEVKKR